MQGSSTLIETLRGVRRRLAALRLLECVVAALAWAALTAVLVLAIHKAGWLDDFWPWAAAALICGIAGGILWAWVSRPTIPDAAVAADERLGLKERLSTALQFLGGGPSPLVPALAADAEAAARTIDPRQAWPVRAPRQWRMLAVAGAVFVGLYFVPQQSLLISPGRRAVKETMKREGKRLQKIAKDLRAKATARDLKTSKRVAKELEKLAKELARAKMRKKQALLKTGALTRKISEEQKRLAWRNTRQTMRAALSKLGKVPLESKAAKDLARSASQRDLEQAAAKLKELAKKLQRGDLTPDEQKKLAKDLEKLSAQLAGSPLGAVASSLSDAADALSSGKCRKAAAALQQASQQASAAAKQMADQQTVQSMADEAKMCQQAIAQADQPCPHCGGKGCSMCQGTGKRGCCSGRGQGGRRASGTRSSSGTFAGHGTTNLEQKGGPMPGYQGEPKMDDPTKHPKWEEKFQSIYAPEHIDVTTQDTRVKGQRTEQGKTYTTIVRSAPEKQPAFAPYYEVYQDYEAAAEDALSREDIPRGYKTYVRDYFDSLQPEGSAEEPGE